MAIGNDILNDGDSLLSEQSSEDELESESDEDSQDGEFRIRFLDKECIFYIMSFCQFENEFWKLWLL